MRIQNHNEQQWPLKMLILINRTSIDSFNGKEDICIEQTVG